MNYKARIMMNSSTLIRLSPYHKIFYNEWKLEPLSNKYNIVFDQTIANTLDIPRLQQALERFIADYLILNSHIKSIDGEPYWVANSTIRHLEVFADVASYDQLYAHVSQPFNIESEPLYRFAIFKQSDGNYRFILVWHHLLIDGGSGNEVITEISNYYNDTAYKINTNLEEQKHLIITRTQGLHSKLETIAQQGKQFWQNLISDTEAIDLRFLRLTNPLAQKSKYQQSDNPIKEIRFDFADNTICELNQFNQQYGSSMYSYGLVVFAMLVHRYTSQTKFAISYPIAIKEHIRLLYGAGINTILCPFKFENNTTILDLIAQYKEFLIAGKNSQGSYQYYPISDILTGENSNILDVFFIQTNLKDTPFKLNNVNVLNMNKDFNIDLPTKLLFEQERHQDRVCYRVRYNDRCVDETILHQFINHYKNLFVEILADFKQNNASKLVSQYQILTDAEYHTVVYDWNNTYQPYPDNKTIHQLFEEQVLRTPDNIAVVYEDIRLTYNELNTKANQLAHYLINNMVKPGDLIALCLDRSEYMLIAILAVLKSGCAYVPIDIKNYPDDRISYILKDSAAKITLVNEVHASKLSNIISCCQNSNSQDSNHSHDSHINIEQDILIIDSANLHNRLITQDIKPLISISKVLSPTSLAYVVYTSGTTGNPKGVMVEHKSTINYVNYLIRSCQLSAVSVGSQYGSFCFDALIIEVFPILISGAKLCIIHEEYKLDPVKINDVFTYYKVSYAFLPSQIAQIFFTLRNASLKTLIVGGDKLNKYIKQSYKVINAYGPTEVTVQSNDFVVDKFYNNIPIGKPIANVSNYILDAQLCPLPIGAIGELFIGGEGITRGYLNNPELTKQRFIINTFCSEQDKQLKRNTVLYKTGDLVRYLADGNIEYIGRNDFQVKIRGYRIELGEVEAALSKYPEIKQVSVHAVDYKKSIATTTACINSENIGRSGNAFISEQGVLNGALEMLPIQEWFFKQNFTNINHWNQSFLIKTPRLDKSILLDCIKKLVKYHDSFRLRYKKTDKVSNGYTSGIQYTQYYANDTQELSLYELDIKQIPYPEGGLEFNNALYQIMTNWQNNFNIKTGALSSFGYIYGYSDGSSRVYIAAHHLIIDVVSWYIILHDLKKLYTSLWMAQKNGSLKQLINNPDLLGKKGSSYRQWVNSIHSSTAYANEREYWLNIISGYKEFNAQLLKLATPYTYQSSISLDKQYTEKLTTKGLSSSNNQVKDILLTAFTFALKELLALDTVYITLEGHGREEINLSIDLTRTVGWFTSMFPVKLTIVDNNSLTTSLHSVQRTLLNIPNKGIGYGVLFAYEDNLPLISFNYLGQINLGQTSHDEDNTSSWSITNDPSGQNIASTNRQHNILSIDGGIIDEHLMLTINSQINQEKLSKFVNTFKTSLINLIDIVAGSVVDDGVVNKCLVAYYVSDSKLETDSLKSFVSKLLPQYSVPEVFVQLSAIPLTTNGKVDTKSLPNPQNINFDEYIAPATEKEELICKAFAKVLGKKRIGITDDFFMLGGDSVLAIKLMMILRNDFSIHVSDIFTFKTPRTLAQHITVSKDYIKTHLLEIMHSCEQHNILKLQGQEQAKYSQINSNIQSYMTSVVTLHPDLTPKNIKNVLLTGATGYLGINILNQLLITTDYNIYLLVRGDSAQSAIERVINKYKLYFYEDLNKTQLINSRVFIFRSDLEKEDFGLAKHQYQELINKIDSIIHAAALINLIGDYKTFFMANVQATINLLELSKLTKLKDFHYISTASLLKHNESSYKDWGNNYTEQSLPSNLEFIDDNVYLKTKLEAEQQVVLYREYGVNSNIYRVGNLAFMLKSSSVADLSVPDLSVPDLSVPDLSVRENLGGIGFTHWLKYLFYSKRVLASSKIALSPVDLTAEAIVKLFNKGCSSNSIYHPFNPYLLDLVQYMRGCVDLQVEVLSNTELIKYIIADLENATNMDIISRFLLAHGWIGSEGVHQFAERNYVQHKTQYILQLLGFDWNVITHEQFTTYLDKVINF